MSISSLVNSAAARRLHLAGDPAEPATADTETSRNGRGAPPPAGTVSSNPVAGLATYIPTEVLTLYVAVVAALGWIAPLFQNPLPGDRSSANRDITTTAIRNPFHRDVQPGPITELNQTR